MLDEHNPLSLVASSQKDEDGARGDGWPQLGLVHAEGLLAVVQLTGQILGRVVAGLQNGKIKA